MIDTIINIVCIILLFFCGVGCWYGIANSRKQRKILKEIEKSIEEEERESSTQYENPGGTQLVEALNTNNHE